MSAEAPRCSRCTAELPAAARFCPGCGARVADGAAPPAPPLGERRQVAVLFADLAGYTRLAGALDAEEVHRLLDRYFALADAAVERMGGTIDKHIGDAVMGVFGAPVAYGNDVERALRAAIDIHAAMATLSAEFGRPLAAHIGVASGEVVAAATGSDAHRTYTVTGDAVNLAARLTDVAAAGETVVSDHVHRAVAALADVDAVGDVEIRGMAQRERVWRLRAMRAPALARQPLVGRDAERRRFAALLGEVATTRTGRVVIVCAEPGMGKTRLIEAFTASALAEGAFCHTATVLDFGAGQGEDAVHALACSLLGVPPQGAPAVRREALTRALAQERACPDDEPYLADLLALPRHPDGGHEAPDTETRRRVRLKALIDVVERAAARAPCVLQVDDVHWASPWVVEALGAVAGCADRLPVVLVMGSRREGAALAAPWPPGRTERFDLAPLGDDDALALARIHFASSPEVARRCVARAQGNPLFLVQLLRSGDDVAAVPASIQSVVLARLDRLPAGDKRALQAAAVVGQRFDLDLLRALHGDARYDAAILIERDLVRADPREPGALMFAHALIRDGAYASLLHSARRDLHRHAARWYEGRDPTLCAVHLDRADDARAAQAYLDAARAEAGALRIDAALALAERGEALAAAPSLRHALAALAGEFQRELGRSAPSIAAFERARDAAADDAERCAAWFGIAAGHRLTSAVAPGLAALAEAEALAQRVGLVRERARIAHLRGNLHFAGGDVALCRSAHEQALALAAEAADAEGEAQALSGLADALYAQGRMISAQAAFERCVAICEREGLARFAIMNRCMIALIDAYRGRLPAALAGFARVRGEARSLQHRLAETMSDESAGMMLVMYGRFAEAREVLARALSLAREIGARRFESIVLYSRAHVLWDEGAQDEARRCAREAWALIREVGPRFGGPVALGGIALTAATDDEAREALAEGERLLAQGCVAHCHLSFYHSAIDVSLRARRFAEAERYAGLLEDFMRPEPLRWSDYLVARGRALAAAGRGAGEREALDACRREAAAMGLENATSALDAAREGTG